MRRRANQWLGTVLALAFASARPSGAEPLTAAGGPGAPPARAPIDSRIEVERGPGSEACPDAAAVFRSLAKLFPERAFRETSAAASAAASARVVIRALPAGYEAVLSMRAPHTGERVIGEKDQACGGLADALALAFVMLVEPPEGQVGAPSGSSAPALPAKPAPPAPSAPQLNAARPAPDAVAPRGARSFTGNIAASGIGGFGLLSKPAAGAALGIELVHASGWGGALGGMRLWSPPSEAQGGSVRLSLWALLAGPCYERRVRGVSSLDACVRVGVGSQSATVEGFLNSRSPSVPWVIVTPTFGYRLRVAGALTGFVRIGPVVQIRPQSFSAREDDGSGRTVQVAGAPKVGVMAELGLLTGGAGF
jgi:hypothetical protein